jgi:4-hydroxyphenylacetate 3-monooxygenase
MRAGAEYVESLRDGRTVLLDGERVEDVTRSPAFRPAIDVVAETYDRAAEAAGDEALTYRDEQSGNRYSTMWQIPRSREDLARRRKLHEFWAEPSVGHMGRTPDHVACLLTAYAGSPHVFERGGAQFADNAQRFYRKAREEDLYIAYVIVPPQVDRSQPAHRQPEPFLYAGAAEERDDGIVVRGAQMIGTSSVMADYVLLTYIVPLQPGDEDYAISVVVPCDAPGLRIYPRRPYAEIANSVFDYPLSARFDETDSLLVFDDVFVPWEDVFIYKDVGLTQAQFHETGAHLLANFQALSRFVIKLRFAAGLANRLAELHGLLRVPPVQAQLGGNIASICATVEALLLAAQETALVVDGVARPNPQYLYTGMLVQRQAVVDLMRGIRELAGGSMLAVPSSERSFSSDETRGDVERYYASVSSPAEERVGLLKLLWDFVGSEFAGRQLQYEMFYSAAQHISEMRVFKHYDWGTGRELVNRCLADVGVERLPAGERV